MMNCIFSLITAIICATGVTFFSSSTCSAKDILFLKNMFIDSDIVTISLNKFIADIEEKSDGRLRILILPPGRTIQEERIFQGVSRGYYSMGVGCSAYYGSFMPVGELLYGLPGDPRGGEDFLDFLYEPYVDNFIQEEYGTFGVDRLSSIPIGGYALFSNKPIENFEKLKSMRIRATGIIKTMFKSIGIDSVYVPYLQMKDSYRNDDLDANVSGSFFEQYDNDTYKYTPHSAKYHLTNYQNCELIINKEILEGLPTDMQELLRREAKALSYTLADNIQTIEHETYLKLEEQKVTFSRILEFEEFYLGQRAVSSWRNYFVTDQASRKYVDLVESHLIQLGYVF